MMAMAMEILVSLFSCELGWATLLRESSNISRLSRPSENKSYFYLVLFKLSKAKNLKLPMLLTDLLFLKETDRESLVALVECKETFSALSGSDVASWLLLLDCCCNLDEDILIGTEVSKSFLIELRPWIVDRLKNKRAPMGSKVANSVLSVI